THSRVSPSPLSLLPLFFFLFPPLSLFFSLFLFPPFFPSSPSPPPLLFPFSPFPSSLLLPSFFFPFFPSPSPSLFSSPFFPLP
ncbi:hypothetical protein ACXWR7_11905, partial [Streptococcus pyogenes]